MSQREIIQRAAFRAAVPADAAAIAALHQRVFGPGRFARSAYRVREGVRGSEADVSPFCRVAVLDDAIVAALRMSEIAIGGSSGALLLGPLAVDPAHTGRGFGRRLITDALELARGYGKRLVVLVGDAPYYGRFGFRPVPPGQITFPGPVDPARILAAELEPGMLSNYRGGITGAAE